MGLEVLSRVFRHLRTRVDSDLSDRLHYKFTVTILIMLMFILGARHYVGHPIECWVPAEFTIAMEQYTENYCWIQNTYWLPDAKPVPASDVRHQIRHETRITYYQWIPFLLLLQAICFYMPWAFWGFFNTFTGINLNLIHKLASECSCTESRYRDKAMTSLADYVQKTLQRRESSSGWRTPSHCCLTLLYLVTKLAFMGNAIGQLLLIQELLKTKSGKKFDGFKLLKSLIDGTTWEDTGFFPRVTLCDVRIRLLGQPIEHTVQCVLIINMFNEKIFIFLWFWYLALAVLTALSFFYWFVVCMLPSQRFHFLRKLQSISFWSGDARLRSTWRSFAKTYCYPDSCLILRFVSNSQGHVIASSVVDYIWISFVRSIEEEPIELTDIRNNNYERKPPPVPVDGPPIAPRSGSHPEQIRLTRQPPTDPDGQAPQRYPTVLPYHMDPVQDSIGSAAGSINVNNTAEFQSLLNSWKRCEPKL